MRGVALGAAAAVAGALLVSTGATAAETFAAARPAPYTEGVWREIGPSPIPAGIPGRYEQLGATTGRVTALVVHPTDAETAFLGGSLGGVWRTTDGGAHWTALFQDEETLAVEDLVLQGSTLWVGTGSDVAAGTGLYRIPDAVTVSAAAAVVEGPFDTRVAGTGTDAGNGLAFSGTVIRAIVIDPDDPTRMYVATADRHYAFGGELDWPGQRAQPGLYFTDTARSAIPTFSLVKDMAAGIVADAAFVAGTGGARASLVVTVGDYPQRQYKEVRRTTQAHVATTGASGVAPVFTRVRQLQDSSSGFSAEIGVAGQTVYVASSEAFGTLFRSRDGGATFQKGVAPSSGVDPATVAPTADTFASSVTGWGAGDHTGGVAVDPTDPDHLYLGGAYSCHLGACGFGFRVLISSADGGVTARTADGPYEERQFQAPGFSARKIQLAYVHADTVAIAYAPSDPDTVWTGNDGGVYRTRNGRATGVDATGTSATVWESRNTPGLGLTQFYEVAAHPTDLHYTLGGTQDNAAVFNHPGGGADWRFVGFGDGFTAQIDQSATDTENTRTFVDCHVRDTTTDLLAPAAGRYAGKCGKTGGFSAQGGGSIYWDVFSGSPVKTSRDFGATSTPLSDQLSAVAATAHGRLGGLFDGRLQHARSGIARVLPGPVPSPSPVALSVALDPADADRAWVGLAGYRGATGGRMKAQLYSTVNLSADAPTWMPAAGLPDLPVTSVVLNPGHTDSRNRRAVFAGTMSGVFVSYDDGATFAPVGTGLPRGCSGGEGATCAARAMARTAGSLSIARPGKPESVLRFGTHGRGMWELPLGQAPAPPTARLRVPGDDAVYRTGQTIVVDYDCTDETAGSGLASCAGTLPDGAAVETARPGLKVFRVLASDAAGNRTETSHSYRVLFDFAFTGDVQAEPAVNVREAGHHVPVTFALTGDHGLDVLTDRTAATPVDCQTGVALGDAVPADGFTTYDGQVDAYTFRWSTPREWAGSCRRLVLRLSDGTDHAAVFRLYSQAPDVDVRSPDGGDSLLGAAVRADYTCVDEPGGSGLASCTGTVASGELVDTTSIGRQRFTVTASDVAGNRTVVDVDHRVVYDYRGPDAPVRPAPEVNLREAGAPTSVSFSLTGDHGLDAVTGVRSYRADCTTLDGSSGSEDATGTLAYDPATDRYTYTWATPRAWIGTCRTLLVSLDDGRTLPLQYRFYAQPPTVTVSAPAAGTQVLLGERVLADYTCADEPGGSGLATCTGDVAVGAPVDTARLGTRTFTVTAADAAGNTTTSTTPYQVVYDFEGFGSPVANPPAYNTVKAGQAVPLKFSLDGDHGLGVVTSARTTRTSCDASLVVPDPVPASPTGSGLSYDRAADQYSYTWKTEKSWAGQCRSVELTLDDGTTHSARFTLR